MDVVRKGGPAIRDGEWERIAGVEKRGEE